MPLAGGDAGTAQTIEQMRRLIEHGAKDPTVHQLAAWIITQWRSVPAFDWTGEAQAIYDYVRQAIRFTRDVYGKETLHTAREILKLGIGDCDDFTVLLLALCKTIGANGRIVTIAGHADAPEVFTHVYPEVEIEGSWVPLDAARKNPQFGLAPQHVYRRRLWKLNTDDYLDVQGLAGLHGPQPNPANLPGAFRPTVYAEFARAQRAGRLMGEGTYGRPALRRMARFAGCGCDRGMGQIDWTGIAQVISASGTGIAQGITASNLPSYGSPLYPYGTASPYGTSPYGQPSAFATTNIPPAYLLIGGGILAFILLRGRG
ncbi:MAG TPA: transglutaminase-like domain-containing protein [Candidatus Dormibacteraeota bacterium]|nr:transglutaminase-like domain-containing protein [Candidatus Dormibacteraeota bacterium]